jgi:hypothetical protein
MSSQKLSLAVHAVDTLRACEARANDAVLLDIARFAGPQ